MTGAQGKFDHQGNNALVAGQAGNDGAMKRGARRLIRQTIGDEAGEALALVEKRFHGWPANAPDLACL